MRPSSLSLTFLAAALLSVSACGGQDGADRSSDKRDDEAACSDSELVGLFQCMADECPGATGTDFRDCMFGACVNSFFASNSCVACVRDNEQTSADVVASTCQAPAGAACSAAGTEPFFSCGETSCAAASGDALLECLETECGDTLQTLATVACEECIDQDHADIASMKAACVGNAAAETICSDDALDTLGACAEASCADASGDAFAECVFDSCSDTDLGTVACEECVEANLAGGADAIEGACSQLIAAE